MSVKPIVTLNDGDLVVLRYDLTVRHVPLGRTFDTQVADFVTVRDGLCTSYTQHIDTALVQRMLEG